MKLQTTDININNNITIDEIDNLIDEITYKKYWDSEKEKYENVTQKNNRIKWILQNFPSYRKLSEQEDTSGMDYIAHTASVIGWSDIKEDIQTLKNKKEELKIKQKQDKLCSTFEELWEKGIQDTKHELNYITEKIKQIENKITNTNNKNEIKKLEKELNQLWKRHDEIFNKIGNIQNKARTNHGLTNNYKDQTTDKIEVKQKGELTLNQHVKQEPTEELLKKYADYIERIDKTTENNLDG